MSRPSQNAALIVIMVLVAAAGTASGAKKTREKSFAEKLCEDPAYECITVNYIVEQREVKTRGGVQVRTRRVYPTWERMWPNPVEREIVRKVNRMNVGIGVGTVLAVPRDMAGKTLMDFSPFPRKIQGHDEKLIVYDPALLAWAAYDPDGNLVRWGPGVGGKDYCPDVRRGCRTPTGKFRVNLKGGPYYRSSLYPVGCSGRSCAPMPWFVHFGEGAGFHHSHSVPARHASHGCVRLFYEDAKWLHEEFAEIGTKVRVRPYGDEK